MGQIWFFPNTTDLPPPPPPPLAEVHPEEQQSRTRAASLPSGCRAVLRGRHTSCHHASFHLGTDTRPGVCARHLPTSRCLSQKRDAPRQLCPKNKKPKGTPRQEQGGGIWGAQQSNPGSKAQSLHCAYSIRKGERSEGASRTRRFCCYFSCFEKALQLCLRCNMKIFSS